MPELVFGALMSLGALLAFLFGLRVSYQTEAGSLGQVPVLVWAVAPPPMAMIGLVLIHHGLGWPGWPWWTYFLVGLGPIYPAGIAINKVGRWRARRHRAQAENR
ncbi:MAG: hypothetical protein OEM59_14435 [Rhodospirillales bacterium]|nr:hypothetical protein [Rhodospirillales bacterium]